MLKLKRKASSVIEYAIILGVASMAVTSMSVYIKRGLQSSTHAMANKLIAEDLYDKHVAAVASLCDPLSDDDCLRGVHQYGSSSATSNATIAMSNSVNQTTQGKITNTTTSETITRVSDDNSTMSGWEECLDGSC